MTMTDPIADMLTRIRNAINVSYESVDVPASKIKVNIAKALKAEGLIRNYKVLPDGNHRKIRIFLKYDNDGRAAITDIKRVSRPGCRIYAKCDEIPPVLNGYGVSILSTSKGVLADREAREQKLGGEILCSVW